MRTLVALLVIVSAAHAEPPQWVDIKGQVMLPDDQAIPVPAKLAVNQDKEHCLGKGALMDDKLLVNPKNRGIRNVIVWLRPGNQQPNARFSDKEIHPSDAKRKSANVVIDQPCCLFAPRVTLARVGDKIVVNNPAPVAHNFFWSSANNGELNVTLAAKQNYKFEKPLVAESSPIPFKCTIHPWMSGVVRVFDHPYFALTDEDGKFEIKNAPAGKYRIVYWHETTGFLGGATGRLGTPLSIEGGANNTLEMKPTDFPVK